MTALKALLIVLAVLWLLGRIRLGALVQYDENGLLARLIAGPLKFTVFPRKELSPEEKAKKKSRERDKKARSEAKKAARERKKAEKEAKWRERHPGQEKEQPAKGGALPPFLKLLPLVSEAAGGLRRLPRIDELTLRVTWASEDPAEAALGYGRANAALGMIWPLLEHNFEIRKHDVGASVDFGAVSPSVLCRASVTTRLGQLAAFGLRLALRFLSIMIRSRAERGEKTAPQKNRRREQ